MISHSLLVIVVTVVLGLFLDSFHRVGRLRSVDVTVSEINIEIEDVNNEFQSLLSLGLV
jgi:hypothetical protein